VLEAYMHSVISCIAGDIIEGADNIGMKETQENKKL
jgi:hypothetical protein